MDWVENDPIRPPQPVPAAQPWWMNVDFAQVHVENFDAQFVEPPPQPQPLNRRARRDAIWGRPNPPNNGVLD